MRRTVSCCYQCQERTSTCHAICERYKKEKEELLKEKRIAFKERNKDFAITYAMKEGKRRVVKSANRR